MEPATNELKDAKDQAHGLKEQLDSIAKKSGSVWTFTVIINTVGGVPSIPPSGVSSGGGGSSSTSTSSTGTTPRCFVSATNITMADRTFKKIEDVRAGDVVLSMDIGTGRLVNATVAYAVRHEADEYMVINGIGVTTEHPMYVNGLWKSAGDIELGDTLTDINGQPVPVTSIEYVDASVSVYNLHTSHVTHNYFAGGVLVHNKGIESNYSGGELPLGTGWAVVGDGPGGMWTPYSELIGPDGRVYSHYESEMLLSAGLAPDTFLREGGATPSSDEASYYSNQGHESNYQRPQSSQRRPSSSRGRNRGARGPRGRRNGNGQEDAPVYASADETVTAITEAVTQTTNIASTVVQTGQAQTQATQNQTAIVAQGNDAMIAELRDIKTAILRLPTAQDQIAAARYAAATTVN